MKQLQQGDVLFEKINNNISKKKECNIQKRGWILADGEVTGHQHRIEETKNAVMYEYFDKELEEKCLLLKILKNNTPVKHEEHKTVYLDKGDYRVSQINEYDPFSSLTRKVRD